MIVFLVVYPAHNLPSRPGLQSSSPFQNLSEDIAALIEESPIETVEIRLVLLPVNLTVSLCKMLRKKSCYWSALVQKSEAVRCYCCAIDR